MKYSSFMLDFNKNSYMSTKFNESSKTRFHLKLIIGQADMIHSEANKLNFAAVMTNVPGGRNKHQIRSQAPFFE